MNHRKENRIRLLVALLAACVAISVYCVWIPAQLQVSEKYRRLNRIWDRIEKGLYLLIDLALNSYFVRTVQTRLVNQGIVKYKRLVHFNMWMVGLSIATDILIIAMMSLKNSFAYMQFHPLAYIIKLNIEISMAELLVKIAKTSVNNKIGDCYERPNAQSMQAVESTSHRNSIVSSASGSSSIKDWELSSSDSSSSPFDVESIEAYNSIQAPGDVCFEFDGLGDVNMDKEAPKDRFGYIDGHVYEMESPRRVFSSAGLWSGTGEAGSSLKEIAWRLGAVKGTISSMGVKEKL
ncbi:hypothetical protein ONS96_014329 [Cadophora gregata f. sp. sojae]|nr:hypothetical protein ONS96_014329 [Cadophora gregata f. sp. sojae]